VYFNIGGGSKLPGSSIDTTVNRLARYNITTKAVSLNPADGEVYSIQHYVINFVSDFRQVGVFSGFLYQ
jgi:hypothetical protein